MRLETEKTQITDAGPPDVERIFADAALRGRFAVLLSSPDDFIQTAERRSGEYLLEYGNADRVWRADGHIPREDVKAAFLKYLQGDTSWRDHRKWRQLRLALRRRIFTTLSALSLALSIAAAGLWVRSYLVSDRVVLWHDPGKGNYVVISEDGAMWLGRWVPGSQLLPSTQVPGYAMFRFGATRLWYVEVVIAFAVLPWGWALVKAIEREVDRDSGLWCRRCRYDLTGNTSGVCPECGTPVSQACESQS